MRNILNHLKANWIKYGFETVAIMAGILGPVEFETWNYICGVF